MVEGLNASITIHLGPVSIEVAGGDLLEHTTIPDLLREAGRELHRYRGELLLAKGKTHGW